VLKKNGIPGAVASLCSGGKDIGQALAADRRVPVVSVTGSCDVGKQVECTSLCTQKMLAVVMQLWDFVYHRLDWPFKNALANRYWNWEGIMR